MDVPEVLASMRDASWYDRPGVARRYHVMMVDGGAGCSRMLPLQEIATDARRVPESLRCARAGCKSRWPAV